MSWHRVLGGGGLVGTLASQVPLLLGLLLLGMLGLVAIATLSESDKPMARLIALIQALRGGGSKPLT